MAYNLAGIRNRVVVDKLDDSTYDPVVVTGFINDAQRSIFNTYDLPYTEKPFIGTLPSNEHVFEFPADYQQALSLVLRTPELMSLDISDYYVPFRDFNRRYPAPALNVPGKPLAWTIFGGKLYFGQPTDAEYTLSLFYTKKSTTLSDDAQVPEVPEEFEEVLVLGAYYRVLERNEDYDLAAAVKQNYEVELRKLVVRLGMKQKASPHVMGQPLRANRPRRR